MTGRRFEVAPPAKINLHLEIIGRRRDGYHELRTLLQSIDLRDRLIVAEAPAGVLELEVVPAGRVPSGDDNLILQAARRMATAIRNARGARFTLIKQIPVGSGLGGGSADAAAALVLLDRLWEGGLDDTRLHSLAAELGSDVPFFLHGGLAVGVGRGDDLIELPDEAEHPIVVAVPNIRVSTADVYARVAERLTSYRQEGTLYPLEAGLLGRPEWQLLTNQLEDIVVSGWPEVGEGLRRLRSSSPVFASLTGSGAASFAVFEDPATARREAAALPAGWFVHVGTTLGRAAARLEVRRVGEGGSDEGDRGPNQSGEGR